MMFLICDNMGKTYVVKDQYAQHFVTFTVNKWVDVFTRKEYVNILISSLEFCQKNKALEIAGWVIMTNHVHLILRSRKGDLSGTIRDFKKFTATKIVKAISENPVESRKGWLLWLLRSKDSITFWQEGYHGKELLSRSKFYQKLEYIHQNPVKAGYVLDAEAYPYSSAADYSETGKGPLEIDFD